MIEQENDFIEKYVKLQHQVDSLSWTDKAGQWEVEVQNLRDGTRFMDYADVVLNCNAVLNKWKWPNINGLGVFKGTLIHSAAWDPEADLVENVWLWSALAAAQHKLYLAYMTKSIRSIFGSEARSGSRAPFSNNLSKVTDPIMHAVKSSASSLMTAMNTSPIARWLMRHSTKDSFLL